MLEVGVVDVSVHPEQALEYNLDDRFEVTREGDTECAWEYLLVVELVLDPGHEKVNVLASRHLEGRFDVVTVGPQVLVFRASRHSRARLGCTKFCQDAIEHINLVVKLDCVDSEPFV